MFDGRSPGNLGGVAQLADVQEEVAVGRLLGRLPIDAGPGNVARRVCASQRHAQVLRGLPGQQGRRGG
eukprot:12671373-Alexandrium_andersonii.AAC.1